MWGFVEGKGTTTESSSYEFPIDLMESGLYEFRLKQIDFDGKFEYSPILNHLHELDAVIELSAPYPNPIKSSSWIDLLVNETQRVRVELFDMTGRKVYTVCFDSRVLARSKRKVEINVDNLPSGQYVVKAIGEEFVRTVSLVVVK